MTSIQEHHIELALAVFDDGVVGPELAVGPFGADGEDEWGLIL